MQSQLAANVQDRMRRIERLVEEPRTDQTMPQPEDEEVVYWRQRIAALSLPVGESQPAPKPQRGFKLSPRLPEDGLAPSIPPRDVTAITACVPPKMKLRVQRRMRKQEEQRRKQEEQRQQKLALLGGSRQAAFSKRPPLKPAPQPSAAREKHDGPQKNMAATDTALCTSCWDPVGACVCRPATPGGDAPAVLCQTCWDVPCACKSTIGNRRRSSGSRNASSGSKNASFSRGK